MIILLLLLLLRPDKGAERSIATSLSVCLSVRVHISGTAGPIYTNYLCRSAVAVARSSSGGVAICYVLPILWMTSCLAVVGRMANGDAWKADPQPTTTSGVAIPWRSVMSMNALFLL